MKRTLCVIICAVLVFSLMGCVQKQPNIPQKQYKSVEEVGEVPEAFQTIIENNLFEGVTAFQDVLLHAEVIAADEENKTVTHRVSMMDTYGKELAAYTCSTDSAYHVDTLTATDDGGFLFVLGFSDYARGDGWASDDGFASRVIKCDKNGAVQFDIPFDKIEDEALEFCFERNGKFYLFGTVQTPETKTQGVHSRTDIYMAIMDENGVLLKNQCIAGSDYDRLNMAECTDAGFVLSIRAQSDDGDFAGSNSDGHAVDWVITVDDDLEITEKKKETGRSFFDRSLGEKNGLPVYGSDDIFHGLDAGSLSAVIDYGDFYLIISENPTGEYEHTPPYISTIWCYTETVYSAYDNEGKLLFRAAVDSSPDFDAWVENLGNQG